MPSQIYEKITNNAYFVTEPNLTYRLGDGVSSGRISGLEAIKQAIYHILMTERYSNPIYDDNYGIELAQYQGKDLGYISSTIEKTLVDALTQDDRIEDVYVNSVEQSKQSNACVIEFTCITNFGEIEGSVNVVQ